MVQLIPILISHLKGPTQPTHAPCAPNCMQKCWTATSGAVGGSDDCTACFDLPAVYVSMWANGATIIPFSTTYLSRCDHYENGCDVFEQVRRVAGSWLQCSCP